MRHLYEKNTTMETIMRNQKLNALSLILTLAAVPFNTLAEKSYSPHADQSYPTNVYWGDTHLHTALSSDAYIFGARLTPDDAYRFAKGETVTATSGQEVRLHRPLDFLMVSDLSLIHI